MGKNFEELGKALEQGKFLDLSIYDDGVVACIIENDKTVESYASIKRNVESFRTAFERCLNAFNDKEKTEDALNGYSRWLLEISAAQRIFRIKKEDAKVICYILEKGKYKKALTANDFEKLIGKLEKKLLIS